LLRYTIFLIIKLIASQIFKLFLFSFDGIFVVWIMKHVFKCFFYVLLILFFYVNVKKLTRYLFWRSS
jgi:hypothetical protein